MGEPVPHRQDGRSKRGGHSPSLGGRDPRLRKKVREGASQEAQREAVGRDEHGKIKTRIDPRSAIETTPEGELTLNKAKLGGTSVSNEFNSTFVGGSGSGGGGGGTGDQGPPGPPGADGAQGPAGPPGDQGDPGDPGDAGPPGSPGTPGQQGQIGPPGSDGSDGDDGAPGQPGAAGAAGAAGAPGAQGAAGPPVFIEGIDGEDGFPGPPGQAGATGATGSTGSTGAPGPIGPPGADGEGGGGESFSQPPGVDDSRWALGPFAFRGVIRPTAITGSNVDYFPTGLGASVMIFQDLSAAASIASLNATWALDGQVVGILNISTFDLTIVDQIAGLGTASYRFVTGFPDNQGIILAPGQSGFFVRDATAGFWRVMSPVTPPFEGCTAGLAGSPGYLTPAPAANQREYVFRGNGTWNTMSTMLDFLAAGEAQGDLLYRNATVWTFLAAGTSGQVLTTGGAGANPAWATVGAGGAGSMGPPGMDGQDGEPGMMIPQIDRGRPINVQRLTSTSSSTYTPTGGTKDICIYMRGGGGGGGYAQGTTAGPPAEGCAGGGGGEGALIITWIRNITGTYTYQVGAGGAGGVGSTATAAVAGSSTTFSTFTAAGGGLGTGMVGTATAFTGVAGGTGAALPSSGDYREGGMSGFSGIVYVPDGTVTIGGVRGGQGGGRGGGTERITAAAGVAGVAPGAGGGGATSLSATDRNGGAGQDGIIVVWEYA